MNSKFKKSSIFLMILLIFMISLGAISASDTDLADESLNQAEDIGLEEVQNDIDETSNDILSTNDVNKTFTDFNTDITDKSEVNLESNYVYSDGDTNYKNGFTIDRELTINGNGQTLNPNGNLLFKIGTNGKLTLNDLTITNSYTSTDAMIQNSGNLILNNVTFTAERYILSSASSNSKFITIQNDGEMTVKNSAFKDSIIHSEDLNYKNIYIYGLIYNTQTITIENTIFDNNKLYNPTENDLGRTIDICAVLHNANTMLLKNVIIQNTNVSYVPYSNNHFEGIIFNEKGKLEINGSIIKDNTIYFPENENSNLMGVIYNEATTAELVMSNSIIIGNTHMQRTAEKAIINNKGTATLDNNYWGTNEPAFSSLISGTTPSNKVVLSFTPEELTAGQEKTFEISYKANDEIANTMPNYNLTVNSKKLGSKEVEIKNGVGQYTYLPITAGEDTVTINGQEYVINVNAAPAGTFTDLKNLIDANDEVNMYSDYTYNSSSDSALQTGIQINKEVTINGNGYTINSTSLARLFNVGADGKLILKNVVLISDYAITSSSASSGNVINKGEILFDEVTFTSKRISNGNGIASAIYNDASGTITIKNSEFIDSISNYTGTSTTMPYGLIYNKGTMTIENSLFDNNGVYSAGRMMSTQNGLIYNTKTFKMTNTTFSNNYITYENTGNALINGLLYFAVGSDAEIDNCTFKENVVSSNSVATGATYLGFGTICVKGGTVNITNCDFIKNSAWTGSAIALSPTQTLTFTSENNTFIENSNNYEGSNPEGGCGGAIYVNYKVIFNSINDKFINNNAVKGGAIYARTYVSGTTSTPADVTATNSIFEGNTATTGSAIYKSDKTTANNNYWGTNDPNFDVLITNGTASLTPDNHVIIKIEGNSNIIPESKGTYTVNFKTNDTDALCELPHYTVGLTATNTLSDESVTLKKGTASFIYTSPMDEGSDIIKVLADSQEITSFEVTIAEDADAKGTFKELDRFIRKSESILDLVKDYTFDADVDSGLENGITIDKELTINGHGFTINSTNLSKLFNVLSGGKLILKDVVLATNYVATGSYSAARPLASFKNAGEVTLSNVTFTANQEVNSTDAAFAASIYNTGTLNIENSRFVDSTINTNTQNCFGLIDNNGGNLKIENTVFDKNSMIDTATQSSTYLTGLIYNMGTLTLTDVNMTNNYMKTPNNGRGLIRAYTNSKITIENSLFENNTLESVSNNAQGTVIYAESGSMTISNSKFIKNTGALSGGAIYSSIATTFNNNTFEKNSASSYGGAIYSSGSSSIYTNNIFKDNIAENGGALYSTVALQASQSYYFKGNTFIGNNATKNGAAVYSGAIGSTTYSTENNTFINNYALEKGGAIYSSGGVRVTKSLFQDNKAGEGVIVYTTASAASTITYSLFDGNEFTSPTGGLLYCRGNSNLNYNYWGTNTPKFDELIKLSGGSLTTPTNIVIITIEGNEEISESDVFTVNFKDNVTGNNVELADYEVNITSSINSVTPATVVIKDGSATFTYNAENLGADTIKAMRNGAEKASLDITVGTPKQTPEFTVVANDVNYTESLDITFTVTNGPTGENIYKWSIFSKNGLLLETGNVTTDNKIITTIKDAGNYTIQVTLANVEGWNDLTVNDTFEIKALQSEIIPTVTVNDDDTVKIDINITSDDQLTDAAGEVSFEIDTTYNKAVENGQATITTNKLTPDTYTVTITYTGDANHAATTKEITFTIKQTIVADDVLNITKSDDNKTYNYTIKLPEDATGNLTVKVGNTTENKALENGEATIILEGLKPGEQEVTITYTGDDKYKPMTKTDTINVPEEPKQTPEFSIVAGDITYGDELNLTFTVTNGPTGENIYKWSIFSKNGLLLETGNVTTDNKIITLIKDVGNYTIQVTLANVEGWNDLTVDDTFEIKNVIDTRSEISDKDINVSMNIPEGTTSPSFNISLPENANGTFTVYVDGTPYEKQLVNGSAVITVENLTVGNHNISTAYSGDDNYKGFATENKTLEIPKATLPGGENALNPTTPEGSDSPSYSINLPLDAKGNLTVTVDGVNYTQPLVNGSATVTVPKLTPGDHNITVTYTGDDKKYASISKNSIYKVAEPIVKLSNNKDVKMLYTAKTPYKVLVTVDGKAVTGEKVTITFNGKTYPVLTDKNGYATLKLPDVKPKKAKYTITAEYKGVKVSNKVKVNSIIKAKNLKVKKSKKVNKIKITLKKVNGKYLKGKTIKIKIKGKTLKAKTNKKGVATFKVKKNVLKKLKVGKKYKYKVTFAKDTVTKKLTIKK